MPVVALAETRREGPLRSGFGSIVPVGAGQAQILVGVEVVHVSRATLPARLFSRCGGRAGDPSLNGAAATPTV
jgi:hypothetical protein